MTGSSSEFQTRREPDLRSVRSEMFIEPNHVSNILRSVRSETWFSPKPAAPLRLYRLPCRKALPFRRLRSFWGCASEQGVALWKSDSYGKP